MNLVRTLVVVGCFAALLPDWDSLDSVRRVHSYLEALALIFFALLVVFDVLAHLSDDAKQEKLLEKIGLFCFAVAVFAEIVAYPYGQRNDTLSANVIGSLDVKAKTAEDNASAAIDKSSSADARSSTALIKAGAADARAQSVARKATELDRKLVATAIKLSETTAKLSETATKLSETDNKRVELEKSLRNLSTCTSPRDIPVWSMRTQNGGVRFNDALRPFSGWTVLIEYVSNDAETFRAATSLKTAFEAAKWNILAVRPSPDPPFNGIEVEAFLPTVENSSKITPDIGFSMAARDVAGKVVTFLHSYNWKASLEYMNQADADRQIILQQGIRIRVGLYPPVWYISPPAMKDWSAAMMKEQKDREEREQEAQQARKDGIAKIIRDNPWMAAQIKAHAEQMEQARQADKEAYISPCRPLESLGVY